MAKQITVPELIAIADKISPLPNSARKALEILRHPEPDMNKLAEVISTDQVMAAAVLHWVNSAAFSTANKISSVRMAVVYLGLTSVKSIILMQGLSDSLTGSVPNYGLLKGELWHRSMGMAVGCRLLTRHLGIRLSDEAYNAGLLCDMGLLPFDAYFARNGIKANRLPRIQDLEIEVSGVTHKQLGAEIARHWQFPRSIQDSIFFHDNPSQCPDEAHRILAAATHVANAMLVQQGIGKNIDSGARDPLAFQLMGINEAGLPGLYERVKPFLEESEILIGLSI